MAYLEPKASKLEEGLKDRRFFLYFSSGVCYLAIRQLNVKVASGLPGQTFFSV